MIQFNKEKVNFETEKLKIRFLSRNQKRLDLKWTVRHNLNFIGYLKLQHRGIQILLFN